ATRAELAQLAGCIEAGDVGEAIERSVRAVVAAATARTIEALSTGHRTQRYRLQDQGQRSQSVRERWCHLRRGAQGRWAGGQPLAARRRGLPRLRAWNR